MKLFDKEAEQQRLQEELDQINLDAQTALEELASARDRLASTKEQRLLDIGTEAYHQYQIGSNCGDFLSMFQEIQSLEEQMAQLEQEQVAVTAQAEEDAQELVVRLEQLASAPTAEEEPMEVEPVPIPVICEEASPPLFCGSCGHKLQADDVFCEQCGSRVSG